MTKTDRVTLGTWRKQYDIGGLKISGEHNLWTRIGGDEYWAVPDLAAYTFERTVLRMVGADGLDAQAMELETFTGLWLHKMGVIARSRKPYISAVRGFYAWLKASGHVRGNAASELVHPMTGRPLPRTISLANVRRSR